MKNLLVLVFSVFLIINPSFAKSKKSKSYAVVEVKLNPVGSFEIKGRIKGDVVEKNGVYTSSKLQSKVKFFKTGMDLRNKHTREKLEYKKYPFVTVTNVKASNGKGSATIKIMDKSKKFNFAYKKNSKGYLIGTFNLSLKDFGISGIKYLGVGVDDTIKLKAVLKAK